MRIGFHSPLPPARTGVADYATALADALRKYGEVVLNPPRPAGLELYHLGNNQLHRPIYERALRHPGVVVLHDAVLQHFFLGFEDKDAYAEEFVFNYGEWNRELAHQLWRNRSRSAQDPIYFQYPMLRRIAGASLAVVVHNSAAARSVTNHVPGARVVEIPHLFRAPKLPSCPEIAHLRALLQAPPRSTLFGVFGYLRESKRLPGILRVFERLQREHSSVALLMAGTFASPNLERSLAPALARQGVVRTGYLEERDFWRHAAAVDVCVNLRYPAAGETSGIGIGLMGIGKATVVSEGGEVEEFPPECCVKVDTGLTEEPMLLDCLRWLAEFPDGAREIGRRARDFIAKRHSVERCAARYWDVLRQEAEWHDSRNS